MYLDLLEPDSSDAAAQQIRRMRAAGMEVPGIVELLAVRPDWTQHLNRFTQAVMRGPGSLPAWQRELLAALTSRWNHCRF
jgi:alkylhydroperoxidase family enzyme